MRPLLVLLLVAGALTGQTLTPRDREELFTKVWTTIRDKYYRADLNGVDWKNIGERYRSLIAAAGSDDEAWSLLNRMAAELRDAHTRVRNPRQREERRKRLATSAGVTLGEVESQVVVVKAREPLQPGTRVLTIDGEPVPTRLAAVREQVGRSSTERAERILSIRRLLRGEPGTEVRLGLESGDVTLRRSTAEDPLDVTWRTLPSGAGYLRLNAFAAGASKQVREALLNLTGARGVIFDLRGNTGGQQKEAMAVVGLFVGRAVPFATVWRRGAKERTTPTGGDGTQAWAGPLVILVDELSASASELTVAALREAGRARVVGTRTCGCVLGVSDHRPLPGGGELDVSEVGFKTPNGLVLEGTGIEPDVTVPLTLADLRVGRDAALEKAESLLP